MDTHPVVKTAQEQLVEARFGEDIPALLTRLYGSGMSQQAVADELGVARQTVIDWMKRHRIPTRDRRAVTAA